MTEIDTFLEHHGVKGMRWGVRKSRNADGSSVKKKSGPPRAHELSDADLKAAVNRMNMERQYQKLTSGGRQHGGARRALLVGGTFVSGLLLNVGKQTLESHLRDQARDAIRQRAEHAASARASQAADLASDLATRAAARRIAGGFTP